MLGALLGVAACAADQVKYDENFFKVGTCFIWSYEPEEMTLCETRLPDGTPCAEYPDAGGCVDPGYGLYFTDGGCDADERCR